MSTTTAAPGPPKASQVWGVVDYHPIAVRDVVVSENLVASAGVYASSDVLDVGAGSCNTALAAARRGARAVGTDVVATGLDLAHRRAAAEGVVLKTQQADAQDLPFVDHSFDTVLSTFGVMYARDHQLAARELTRVCRPGGRVGLANWTPDSMVARLQRVLGSAAGGPPPGGPGTPPVNWGTEDYCRDLLADRIQDLIATRRRHYWCAASAQAQFDLLLHHLPPWNAMWGRLNSEQRQWAENETLAAFEEANLATDGSNMVAADYLEVIAVVA